MSDSVSWDDAQKLSAPKAGSVSFDDAQKLTKAKPEAPKASFGQRMLGNAANVGDLVMAVPGFLDASVETAFAAPYMGVRGLKGDPDAPSTHKEWSKATSDFFHGTMEMWPTTGYFNRKLKEHGMAEGAEQSAAGQVQQKIGSALEKAGKKVEKATGGAINQEDVDTAINMFGPHAVGKGLGLVKGAYGKFLSKAKESIPPGEVEKGSVSKGTASKLLDQYEKEGGKATEDQIKHETDADINAHKVAHDLVQRGASLKEVEAMRKRWPLVGEKIDEIMARRQEIRQGPMSHVHQGEVLPPRTGMPQGTGVPAKGPETFENAPKRALPLSKQAGQVNPKLLGAAALGATGAAIGGMSQDDKLEKAIMGGLTGVALMTLPKVTEKVTENWKKTLKPIATTAAVSTGLAALDKDHPVEGALLGLAWGARGFLPKATIPKVGNMTIDELTNMRNGNIAAENRNISNVANGLRTIVQDPLRREAVAHAVESGDLSGLSGNEQKAARIYKGFTKAYGEAAKDAGVLDDFVKNYVTHIVEKEGLPKSAVGGLLGALGFGAETRGPGTSTSSAFAKHRKYATFDELQKALEGSGLKIKTKDIAEISEIYGRSMNRAIENRKYVEALKAGKTPEGKALVMKGDKAPVDYVHVDSPQLREMSVHPDLAPSVKFVMEAANPGEVTKGLLALSMASKRLSTSYSFFHAANLANAFVASSGLKSFSGKGAIDAALKAYREGGLGDTTDLLLRSGLKVAEERPMELDQKALAKAGQLADGIVNKALGTKVHAGEKALGAAERLQTQVFDKVTWDYLHTGMKLAVATREFERLSMKHPELPKEQVAQQVSAFVNDTFGGLDWYRVASESESQLGRKMAMSALSPKGRQGLQILMFAPDWTFSTFRALYKALPDLGEGKEPLTRELHRKYALRTAALYFTLLNGINMQTSGHSILDNKDPTKLEYKDGTTQQVAKHAMEGYEWLLKPRQTALNKLAPIVKEPAEQLLNKQYLSADGKAPPMGSRLGHAANAVLPLPLQGAGQAGRSPLESAKRAAQSAVGMPVYGMTAKEKAASSEERARAKRLRELRGEK